MTQDGRLLRKYVVIFVGLVSVSLIASGGIQSYFAYQEKKDDLVRIQAEHASVASLKISQFVAETERQISSTIPLPLIASSLSIEERRNDFARLLRQADAIMSATYLDASGIERLSVS